MFKKVLVLDDEYGIVEYLRKYLTNEGYDVYCAISIEEANHIIVNEKIDYAIIDLKLDYSSEYGGINSIEKINKFQPQTRTIVLTAYEWDAEIEKHLKDVKINGFISKGGNENYIKAIIKELSKLNKIAPPKTCFVIMPFSETDTCSREEWTDIFENTIKPAVEESGFDYTCFRANLKMGNIIKDIIENLDKADIVIADMTDRNPNVFYELGVRHSLKDATILITQNLSDIPFDLQHFAAIEYKWKTKKGREDFKIRIKEIIGKIENSSANILSPVRDYLKLEK